MGSDATEGAVATTAGPRHRPRVIGRTISCFVAETCPGAFRNLAQSPFPEWDDGRDRHYYYRTAIRVRRLLWRGEDPEE